MESSLMFYLMEVLAEYFWFIFVAFVSVFFATLIGEYYVTRLRREVKKREAAEVSLNEEKNKLLELGEELQHKNDRLDAILSSMGEGILVCDNKREVLLLNQQGSALMRVTPSDMLGKSIDKFTNFVCKNKTSKKSLSFADLVGQVMDETNILTITQSDHYYCQRDNAEDVPVTMVIAPLLREGKNNGVITLFRDSTKEKEIDEMKSTFVSFASHQLRTPLTGIRWYVEELLQGDAGRITKKQRELINEMYTSTKHMIRLVNDLLNVSRVESGKLKIDPESTDLPTFIRSVINEMKPLLAQRDDISDDVEIVCEAEAGDFDPIPIDQTLLRQVLHNFLTNAIKYSPDMHIGDIVVELEKEKNGDYTISVIDHGIGIPKNEQSHIFNKFFRATNADELSVSGTGLGLYVVKLVVETSGGEVGFSSAEGKGSTFFVKIPAEGMMSREGSRELAT